MGRLMLQKTADVLDLFSLERPEWGVSEVSRELGIPKSTACELLISLTDQRLLQRTRKGRYRLGWRLFELSQTLLDTTEFRIEARRVMEELVRSWEETVHLAVLDGVQAVYVEKLQPTPAVKIRLSRTGARLPAHCSGVGKVLLAHSDWEQVTALFEDQGLSKLTGNTITTLDALADELERVREQGYAYDDEETLIGLCCVAAPIRNYSGEVAASVSISAPACRFHPSREEYTKAIIEATRSISVSIGYGAKECPVYEREELQEV